MTLQKIVRGLERAEQSKQAGVKTTAPRWTRITNLRLQQKSRLSARVRDVSGLFPARFRQLFGECMDDVVLTT